jgi:hypothetical protein
LWRKSRGIAGNAEIFSGPAMREKSVRHSQICKKSRRGLTMKWLLAMFFFFAAICISTADTDQFLTCVVEWIGRA